MRRLFVAGLFASMAFAAVAHADPAMVIKPTDGLCTLRDGNGDVIVTTDTQVVATQSTDGSSTFKCEAKNVPNDTGSAVTYDFDSTGSMCGIPNPFGFQITENWQVTVSSGGDDGLGNATLVCHFP